jgi:hypothetical protein
VVEQDATYLKQGDLYYVPRSYSTNDIPFS